MTYPDLARELEELLPCSNPVEPPRILCLRREMCDNCLVRPAILAYVKHKLDEARADSELLAKVEEYIRRHEYLPDCTYIRESGGFYLAGLERGYPTLVEALRKLVGEEP